MEIVGLDLSLTATGVASVGRGSWVVGSKHKGVERLNELEVDLVSTCREADLVVIEGYAFGAKNAREAMGELGGVVRLGLYRQGVPFAVVQPTVLKKFTTGKGNSPKDEMLLTASRRYGFFGMNNNEADAWMLMLMGRAHHGLYQAEYAYQKESLKKVEWP